METLGWVVCIVLIVVGVAGTVLPVLPGTLFVLAGIVGLAWLDGFQRLGAWPLAIVTVLALAAFALDAAAALLGAKKVGASRQAMWGAAIGTVVGLAMGLVGVLFMPLVGAGVGEYLARRDTRRAMDVGFATWVGLLAGMLGKLLLALMMVGVAAVAWWMGR